MKDLDGINEHCECDENWSGEFCKGMGPSLFMARGIAGLNKLLWTEKNFRPTVGVQYSCVLG